MVDTGLPSSQETIAGSLHIGQFSSSLEALQLQRNMEEMDYLDHFKAGFRPGLV